MKIGDDIMFKGMRRSDREISFEEVENLLTEGEYGVLATIGENSYPYAVPLSYVYVDAAVYFHCATIGNKLDNLKYNEKISFCVVGSTKVLPDKFSTEYESAIIYGTATEISGEEKKKALIALADKYSPEFKAEGLQYIDRAIDKTSVVKISIDKVTGKARR